MMSPLTRSQRGPNRPTGVSGCVRNTAPSKNLRRISLRKADRKLSPVTSAGGPTGMRNEFQSPVPKCEGPGGTLVVVWKENEGSGPPASHPRYARTRVQGAPSLRFGVD